MIDNHVFNIEDAVLYGIEKAVLLYNIRFWIAKNMANQKHAHDGFVWTYNSQQAFAELFPYMSTQKIGRHLREMEKSGLIKSGNYNRAGYDRTKWYTVPSMFIVQNQTMDSSKTNNALLPIEQPIPDINTDISTDTKDIDQAFETFWSAGMKKLNKKGALAPFKKAFKESEFSDPMLFALHLSADISKRKASGQFGFDKMHPTTYLNQQRWNDDYETNQPTANAQGNRKLSAAEENENRLRQLYGKGSVEGNGPSGDGVHSTGNDGHLQQPMEAQQTTIELGADDWRTID